VVEALTTRVLQGSAPLIESGVSRSGSISRRNLPPVAGDESALQRVFQNLVGNAIKYGAGGDGSASTRGGAETRVSITVSDRGIGNCAWRSGTHHSSPSIAPPMSVAAQVQGAGLGISSCSEIVRAHGGRVVVKIAKAAGSQFNRPSPMGREQTADQAKNEQCRHQCRGPRRPVVRRVLLVEDEPGLVLTLTDRLAVRDTRSRPLPTARLVSTGRRPAPSI
jgi:light-regulated signal transduction histidine kinase (bacteriophytochrome)